MANVQLSSPRSSESPVPTAPQTLTYLELVFFDTAFGSPSLRNNVVAIDQLKIPAHTADCYTTKFRFGEEYKRLCDSTGSVTGAGNLPCWCDFVWFDIDSEDLITALANARSLVIKIELIDTSLSEQLAIYFSGSKGFHIGIPTQVFGLEPGIDLPAQLKTIAKRLAGDIAVDTSIYDKNRLWRVPNTINSKSGLYKIPLTYDEFATWSIEQIREKAKTPHGETRPPLTYDGQYKPIPALVELAASVSIPREGNIVPSGGQNSPGWIAEALTDLAPGNRNSTFAKIAGRLSRDGWLEQDIVGLLTPHADRVGFPPVELEQEVRGICSRYAPTFRFPNSDPIYTGKPEIGTLTPVSLDQLLSEDEGDIEWLVDRVFPVEGAAIIGGAPGIGKSWMLLDLGLACATGKKWLGQFQTIRGPVLYVDEESSARLVRSRCRKLMEAYGINSCPDVHFLIGKGICLTDQVWINGLKRVASDISPRVIIFDSLIRLHQSEENSATEMARVFAAVKELSRECHCLIVFADHRRKPGQNETDSGLSLRGSSEKVAFVDSLLSVSRHGDHLVVEHSKSRYGEPVSTFQLKLEEPIPGLVQLTFVGEDDEIRASALQEQSEKLILECLGEGERTRQQVLEAAKGQGIPPKAIDQALKKLSNEGGPLLREDRRPEGGPGGRTAYFRLSTTRFPVSKVYSGKSEIGTSDEGVA